MIMRKKMESTYNIVIYLRGLCRGYIGKMVKNMEIALFS